MICLFALNKLQAQIPQIAKNLADMISRGENGKELFSTFLLLALGILVFRTLSRLLFFYPARIQQRDLRVELIDRFEKASPSSYLNWNSGQIYQVIVNDLNRLRALMGFAFMQVGNNVMAAGVLIPTLIAFNSKFLIALIPLGLATLIYFILVMKAFPHMKKQADLDGETQNVLMESFNGKQSIQTYNKEFTFGTAFERQVAESLKYFYKSSVFTSISTPLMRLGFGVSLIWGAWIVYEDQMKPSDLILFSGFLYLIMVPLRSLSWVGVVASGAMTAWKRLKSMLNDLDQEVAVDSEGNVDFWGEEINFDFQNKKWNVLVGDTGVGKTHCLEQFCEYLKQENKRYSLVAQSPYLFNTTLGDNILLSREVGEEVKSDIRELCTRFYLDDLIQSDEDILELKVGEKGKRLSGGQAKRVALIRSLISETDWIIWDDPFSSVDPYQEKLILDYLKESKWIKDRGFILSSHRLTTVRYCDYSYLLDKNKKGISSSGEVKAQLDGILGEYFAKQMV